MTTSSLAGKIALVPGAARPVGRAIARRGLYLRYGRNIARCCRRPYGGAKQLAIICAFHGQLLWIE